MMVENVSLHMLTSAPPAPICSSTSTTATDF
jgi:hypothetical protein